MVLFMLMAVGSYAQLRGAAEFNRELFLSKATSRTPTATVSRTPTAAVSRTPTATVSRTPTAAVPATSSLVGRNGGAWGSVGATSSIVPECLKLCPNIDNISGTDDRQTFCYAKSMLVWQGSPHLTTHSPQSSNPRDCTKTCEAGIIKNLKDLATKCYTYYPTRVDERKNMCFQEKNGQRSIPLAQKMDYFDDSTYHCALGCPKATCILSGTTDAGDQQNCEVLKGWINSDCMSSCPPEVRQLVVKQVTSDMCKSKDCTVLYQGEFGKCKDSRGGECKLREGGSDGTQTGRQYQLQQYSNLGNCPVREKGPNGAPLALAPAWHTMTKSCTLPVCRSSGQGCVCHISTEGFGRPIITRRLCPVQSPTLGSLMCTTGIQNEVSQQTCALQGERTYRCPGRIRMIPVQFRTCVLSYDLLSTCFVERNIFAIGINGIDSIMNGQSGAGAGAGAGTSTGTGTGTSTGTPSVWGMILNGKRSSVDSSKKDSSKKDSIEEDSIEEDIIEEDYKDPFGSQYMLPKDSSTKEGDDKINSNSSSGDSSGKALSTSLPVDELAIWLASFDVAEKGKQSD